MRQALTSTLVCVAGSAVVLAAPRETATFSNVPSNGTYGSSFNAPVIAHTFAGADGAGSYAARYLTIAGTLIDPFDRGSPIHEAMIEITPPGGTPFIAQPFTEGAYPFTGSAHLVPVGLFSTAGEWRFRFFEALDTLIDTVNVVDVTWSTVSITLDDGPPPVSPAQSSASIQFTNVPVDGTGTNPIATRTWFNTALLSARPVLRIRGALSNLRPSNSLEQQRIRITPPNGATPIIYSTSPLGRIPATWFANSTINLPTSFNPVGQWTFEFFEAAGANSRTSTQPGLDSPGGPDSMWAQISFELTDRVAGFTPIELVEGQFVSASTPLTIGNVAWFAFVTPPTLDATGAIDIDVHGTALAPLNDTNIALYTSTGTYVDSDEDTGHDLLSQMSFGLRTARRSSAGNGERFRAQSGETDGADAQSLAANTTYFLAVASNTNFMPTATFGMTGGTNAGTVTARVRAYATNAPSDPITPPPLTALGTLTHAVQASASAPVPAGGVAWFSFNLPVAVDPFNNAALQLDTQGSTSSPTGPFALIGLYNADGHFIRSDNGDGPGFLGMLTFGVDNRPGFEGGLPFDGRDFRLSPGMHYLAVGAGGSPQFTEDFVVTNTNTTHIGVATVNARLFHPSLPVALTPPAATDLGTLGTTTPGAEHLISVTHVIAPGQANDPRWYRFSTLAEASTATSFFLDIDTEGTAPASNTTFAIEDTRLALYTHEGFRIAWDSISGTGPRAQLSFGDAIPPRPAFTPNGAQASQPRNGSSGYLPAGTYYLLVAPEGTGEGIADFAITSPTARTATGTRTVSFRTNLPPAACSIADVAGPGQSPVADENLTADDIIVFIGLFFTGDARADVAGPAQSPGPDGNLTADDIIVFIGAFFAGC